MIIPQIAMLRMQRVRTTWRQVVLSALPLTEGRWVTAV
jgi:hypothetical protein